MASIIKCEMIQNINTDNRIQITNEYKHMDDTPLHLSDINELVNHYIKLEFTEQNSRQVMARAFNIEQGEWIGLKQLTTDMVTSVHQRIGESYYGVEDTLIEEKEVQFKDEFSAVIITTVQNL